MNTIVIPIAHKLYKYLYFQIIITLFCLPLLLAWGLELSLFSFIGNLVFAPFLFLFLFFSTIIFFTQLIQLPNYFFIWCLEKSTALWLYLLEKIPASKPFVCAKPSVLILLALVVLLFGLIHTKIFMRPKMILVHLGAFIMVILFLKQLPIQANQIILFNDKPIHIYRCNNQTVLIDPGYFGKKTSESAIMYDLKPQIIKQMGTTTIDHLILCKPSNALFKTISLLLEHFEIKTIYMPFWQGNLSQKGKYHYAQFKRYADENKIIVQRIGKKSFKTDCFFIKPLKNIIKNGDFTFSDLQIVAWIDNNQFTFYSASCESSTRVLSQKETI